MMVSGVIWWSGESAARSWLISFQVHDGIAGNGFRSVGKNVRSAGRVGERQLVRGDVKAVGNGRRGSRSKAGVDGKRSRARQLSYPGKGWAGWW